MRENKYSKLNLGQCPSAGAQLQCTWSIPAAIETSVFKNKNAILIDSATLERP